VNEVSALLHLFIFFRVLFFALAVVDSPAARAFGLLLACAT
jgi:hypothetical protein